MGRAVEVRVEGYEWGRESHGGPMQCTEGEGGAGRLGGGFKWTLGIPATISTTETPSRRRNMGPLSTAASCAASEDTLGASGTTMPRSTATQPATASMHTRACFSSASRDHLSGTMLESRSGSKPTSPAIVPSSAGGAFRNGIAFDLAWWGGEREGRCVCVRARRALRGWRRREDWSVDALSEWGGGGVGVVRGGGGHNTQTPVRTTQPCP